MNFENKLVVVTGGANGIGKAIVEGFRKQGAKVIVIDIDSKDNDCDYYYCGDLTKEEVLVDFADIVIQKYGKIDCLINNAGISRKGILSNCSFDEFNEVFKVVVIAPYMLTKLFLNHFNEKASIVNISSTRANMSQPDTESYSAAKGGIISLTHSLAISLAGKVRVNSVSPGWIDTTNTKWELEDHAQHPVKRIGSTEDIVNVVMFLCSEKSSFITGENITVDGGMSKLMIYHNDFGWKYDVNQ